MTNQAFWMYFYFTAISRAIRGFFVDRRAYDLRPRLVRLVPKQMLVDVHQIVMEARCRGLEQSGSSSRS